MKKSVTGIPSILRHILGVVKIKLSVKQKVMEFPINAIFRTVAKRTPIIKASAILISIQPIKFDTICSEAILYNHESKK